MELYDTWVCLKTGYCNGEPDDTPSHWVVVYIFRQIRVDVTNDLYIHLRNMIFQLWDILGLWMWGFLSDGGTPKLSPKSRVINGKTNGA